MFIALEVALVDGSEGTSIQVDWDRSVEFNNGILADAVAKRAGIDQFDFEHYYTGSDARRIWQAVDDEYQLDRPWFTPERWADLQDRHSEAE